MQFGPDYTTSVSMIGGMGGRIDSSKDLLETVEGLRDVAEQYGLEDAYEQIEVRGEDDAYTLAELDERDDHTVIEDVEINYDLGEDRTLECTYSKSVFDDNAFVFVWGDDDLRTEVEDETGHLLYGTGWKRLPDLGRSLWRDLD
jgi:hypothetical protein